ncbi:hypothetical protein NB688_000705 [Xanthomonas sacchari]|uniref:Uncharacterized protein n=1 Tax=Xanthomonas sacchari TaxID=56458 RepID=A0ABT3DTR8_9XANT|nr:hypothetical protein [Xanthomonas sacchari]MCW0398891.1 hypothetical protein [Xanthomonas sacchari]MCW0418539.1 hypothetical protein [Xanthomonas sacchari]
MSLWEGLQSRRRVMSASIGLCSSRLKPLPQGVDRVSLWEGLQSRRRMVSAGIGLCSLRLKPLLRVATCYAPCSRAIARQPMSWRWNSLAQWICSTPA